MNCYQCKRKIFSTPRRKQEGGGEGEGGEIACSRACCGEVFFHRDCIRVEHLKACPSCEGTVSGKFKALWRLSTPPIEGGDAGEPLAKRRKLSAAGEEETCLICLENLTETQGLTKTACCNQAAHVICLQRYYVVPESCAGLLEHKRVRYRLSKRNCFVCRGTSRINAPLDKDVIKDILPAVDRVRFKRRECDAMESRWFTMFQNQLTKYVTSHWDMSFLEKLSRKFEYQMSVEQVVACAQYEDVDLAGTTSGVKQVTFGEPKRGSARHLSEYLLWLAHELITRHWAFPLDDGDESEDLTEFALHKILEICIEVTVTQHYRRAVRAKGEDVDPFAIVYENVSFSTWKCTGRLFGFEQVNYGSSGPRPKLCNWKYERVDKK